MISLHLVILIRFNIVYEGKLLLKPEQIKVSWYQNFTDIVTFQFNNTCFVTLVELIKEISKLRSSSNLKNLMSSSSLKMLRSSFNILFV